MSCFSLVPKGLVCHFQESSVVALVDNDSEDEGTSKTTTEKKVVEPAEAAGEQEDDCVETGGDGEADDEEGSGEEDGEVDELVEGVDSGSEREGRQTQSTSMSSRSESKPYSSVTHKCEVRNISLSTFTISYYFSVYILLVPESEYHQLSATSCGISLLITVTAETGRPL